MKKLLAALTVCSLFFGMLNAKGLEVTESAALFHNSADADTLVLSNQDLATTQGKFLWVLLVVGSAALIIASTLGPWALLGWLIWKHTQTKP